MLEKKCDLCRGECTDIGFAFRIVDGRLYEDDPYGHIHVCRECADAVSLAIEKHYLDKHAAESETDG